VAEAAVCLPPSLPLFVHSSTNVSNGGTKPGEMAHNEWTFLRPRRSFSPLFLTRRGLFTLGGGRPAISPASRPSPLAMHAGPEPMRGEETP